MRAGASERNCLSVDNLSPDETELIMLLFEILGWRVVTAKAKQQRGARLRMARVDGVIQVATDDPALARQLARAGLDRLVTPLNLAAMEHLSTLAG